MMSFGVLAGDFLHAAVGDAAFHFQAVTTACTAVLSSLANRSPKRTRSASSTSSGIKG